MGAWAGLFYLILPILLLVVLVTRSRKQQRAVLAVQDEVGIGDTVMMTSGVFGEVVAIGDDGVIELEVAPGVRTRWMRQAVARVVTEPDAAGDVPARTIDLPQGATGDGRSARPGQERPPPDHAAGSG